MNKHQEKLTKHSTWLAENNRRCRTSGYQIRKKCARYFRTDSLLTRYSRCHKLPLRLSLHH